MDPDFKMLPYIVHWFDREIKEAAINNNVPDTNINPFKLSAIYQFARDEPMSFIPGYSNKRRSKSLAMASWESPEKRRG